MGKRDFFANAALRRAVVGSFLIFIVLFVLVFNANAEISRRYAKPEATGAGDCLSWASACTLQTALDAAVPGQEIWVAKGVHYAGMDRNYTFYIMKSGVQVYGGFTGTETLLSERDWIANPTVLSGDVDQNDTSKDANGIVTDVAGIVGTNANLVLSVLDVDATGVLDGFVINAGQSNNEGGGVWVYKGSPTLKNLVICANAANYLGAGLYNREGSPNLTNVAFRGNYIKNDSEIGAGGGMFNYMGSPTLSNVLFSGNYADEGAGFVSVNGSPTLKNATFSGNRASQGGAIAIWSGNINLINTIIWGNSSAIAGTGATVTSSIIEGGYSGNLDVDPLFVSPQAYTNAPTTAGDYHLRSGSPAIDAGSNTTVIVLTDLDGNPRILGSTVDMGAYEGPTYLLFLPLIAR